MLTDTQMFVAVQQICNEKLDIVYSTLALPNFSAIHGIKDGVYYIWHIWRDGTIKCEKAN